MRIINLIENTQGCHEECLFEHGLSFYIETAKHHILVDTGATGAFIENAKMLGVDLNAVDTVVLSHGHYDHAGGILKFAKMNSHARIYMQKLAGAEYYRKDSMQEKYIGIDAGILQFPQVELVDGDNILDEELFLFGKVTGRKLWPKGNLVLKEKREDAFYQDEFLHEQYLVAAENGRRVLISGCAHNGILNILDRYRDIYGTDPDAVVSGFHMMKRDEYTEEDLKMIKETATELKKLDTMFYTGHCTGEIPYQILKEHMGEQLVYVHSGDEIIIPN